MLQRVSPCLNARMGWQGQADIDDGPYLGRQMVSSKLYCARMLGLVFDDEPNEDKAKPACVARLGGTFNA